MHLVYPGPYVACELMMRVGESLTFSWWWFLLPFIRIGGFRRPRGAALGRCLCSRGSVKAAEVVVQENQSVTLTCSLRSPR